MLGVIALASLVIGAVAIWRRLDAAFLFLVLTTEFFYVDIGGGAARPYHFLAVLVVLAQRREVPRLFSSPVFIGMLAFATVNLVAVVAAENPGNALFSYALFVGNIVVGVAVALVLSTHQLAAARLKRLIIAVVALSVVWGLAQIVAYRLTGFNLGLSDQQEAQVAGGFGPGFRTEANSFGKFSVVMLLMFLPEFVERPRVRRNTWLFALLVVSVLMNFTRSAIYGLALALPIIVFWYVRRGSARRLGSAMSKAALLAGLGLALVFSGALSVSEYARYKVENLFDQEEIVEGASSGYRLEMMRLIIDDSFSDSKKMVIGNGWGQTVYYWGGRQVRAGGGDAVTALGYAGLIGVLAYLYYMLVAIFRTGRFALNTRDDEQKLLAEGVMFALLGISFGGQMAGYFIAPEYWVLLGAAIYMTERYRAPALGAARPRPE